MTTAADFTVGTLIAVRIYDRAIEIRRVMSLDMPEDIDVTDSVAPDNYLPVRSERVDGSDSVFQRGVSSELRGGLNEAADDGTLADMGYRRTGDWQADGYGKIWSAPVERA